MQQLPPEAVREQLKQTAGIVYELDERRTEELPPTDGDPAAHSIYVIRKLHRAEDGTEATLRYYYVMDGVVYEAPTLAAVVRARLQRLGWYLSEAFQSARLAAEPDADEADQAGPAQKRQRL